jgi:putative ABC transport system permease protein
MLSTLRQTLVVARANILGLRRRAAISAAMAFSIALSVCVLVGFLAMAAGFESVLRNSGSQTVAVVLGGGTNQETGSDISADAIRALKAIRAGIGVETDAAGHPLMSDELVQAVALPPEAGGAQRSVSLRGMGPAGPGLRDGLTVSEGRMFRPGSREITVGAQLAADIPSLSVGSTVRLGAVDWQIVGHFTAGGSIFESEIWTDADDLRAAFDRQGQVQTLRLRLTEAGALDGLDAVLRQGLAVEPLDAVTEADLYAGQSARTADMIRLFGWPVAILMAFGATAGALNTMMSSVSNRTVEIATLRALGFSRLSAFGATWFEALALALIGTLAGLAASWMVFNGWQASTLGANDTRMVFRLVVDGGVMRTVLLFGLAIGLIGGFFPALSATRIPLIAALRAQA